MRELRQLKSLVNLILKTQPILTKLVCQNLVNQFSFIIHIVNFKSKILFDQGDLIIFWSNDKNKYRDYLADGYKWRSLCIDQNRH